MRWKLAAPDSVRNMERAVLIRNSFGWSPIVDRTIEVYESALPVWQPRSVPLGKKRLEFGS
jgi:hypothetical protein